MGYVIGQSRYQSTLFPQVLDEVVSTNATARVIDGFIDRLRFDAVNFIRRLKNCL